MDMEITQTNFELPPLKVKCTDADCNRELHCFKFLKRTMPETDHGACRYCGVKLIDWERVHERDGGDVQHTFDELQHEYIRHHFWHKAIDEKATLHARRKGRTALIASVRRRVETSVGRATPYRDGQQTPMEGNVLYYAQHATASCCRTCIEYWHGIPKGRELTHDEIGYLTALIIQFLNRRIPDLPAGPEKIPRKPKNDNSSSGADGSAQPASD
ncbi:DUF4186 family protein [Paraburkholderia fungorum]|nr:DUF4186 family protein [Paraburkholderia fungorum]